MAGKRITRFYHVENTNNGNVGYNTIYFHEDHLGSPLVSSNPNGAIRWRESYSPFGEGLIDPTDNYDQPGFTGHIKDRATGLNYMQARYYDPVMGRFLSHDPVQFSVERPLMFNRYAYTEGNPVNMIDPDGRVPYLLAAMVRRQLMRGAHGAMAGATGALIVSKSAQADGAGTTKAVVKAGLTGFASGLSGNKKVTTATAGFIGFTEGVLTANSSNPKEIFENGMKVGAFDAITTGVAIDTVEKTVPKGKMNHVITPIAKGLAIGSAQVLNENRGEILASGLSAADAMDQEIRNSLKEIGDAMRDLPEYFQRDSGVPDMTPKDDDFD